ncbi:YlbF family regulator [Thermoanaerobacterium sp. RBIITD]|uniref:YlbF family regulator n=1 Tax=Thermoanaerobacterium sp. RBIITD TaxID=1550240 RepID=UPI000BB973F2|nr:YlbF family regulator [Thermoanaerobacterium sp. RBIITD]SNX55432.1 Control of competence regulator ComK, YlbF/YmcA [Thermoanaerobacterium sp. RBIITD]
MNSKTNIIIDKTKELGELLANSDILLNLRESEAIFLNDSKVQSIISEMNKLKVSNNDKIKKLNEELLQLDSYMKLINAQEAAKKLIDEIHGILNYYINGVTENCNSKSCSGCKRHCNKR